MACMTLSSHQSMVIIILPFIKLTFPPLPDESNTTTTTITTVSTTTRRSTQSKQRISRVSTTTTTTKLDSGLRDEKGEKVDEERQKPQLLGKDEDETVMEERMEGNEGGKDRELLVNNSARDSDGKGSTEEAGTSTTMPQFKFAMPKAVSKKRQMRGKFLVKP